MANSIKLLDHYDWIVLGDHPGALLSAGLVARLGLSVLVLPFSPEPHVLIPDSSGKDGVERALDFETSYVLGLGRAPRFSGLVFECLSRLGIQPAEAEQILLNEPLPQILTPQMRVHFGEVSSSEEGQFSRELQREIGTEKAAQSGLASALKKSEGEFLSFWLDLPNRLTLNVDESKARKAAFNLRAIRRRLANKAPAPAQGRWLLAGKTASALSREINAKSLQQTLSGLWFGLTAHEHEDPGLSPLLHLMALGHTGAAFKGGVSAYRELLLRLASRLGAHVPAKTECIQVLVQSGRFAGVKVSGRDQPITAGGAVFGGSLSLLQGKLGMSGRSWIHRLREAPAPTGWKFALSFTVRAAAIPPGTSRRMIWNEPGAPVLEIEIVDSSEYGFKSDDRKLVFARTMLPFTTESLDPEYQRMISARMLRQLTELLPFFEEHLLSVYPDFRKPVSSGEMREVYPFKKLDQIPASLRVTSGEKSRGVGSRSGIDGLFVASDESFPELGSFGATVAAFEAVSWAAHRSGLAGPFV